MGEDLRCVFKEGSILFQKAAADSAIYSQVTNDTGAQLFVWL